MQSKERGREKSNKITEQWEEFHFPPAIPGAGGIIAGILVLGIAVVTNSSICSVSSSAVPSLSQTHKAEEL